MGIKHGPCGSFSFADFSKKAQPSQVNELEVRQLEMGIVANSSQFPWISFPSFEHSLAIAPNSITELNGIRSAHSLAGHAASVG